tara:strand:- start:187 stop:945 length:759 start_codon:yes stop_codon:yes gene_type:complete
MTTKIPAELSSTPGISDSSNATAITIDSSEEVGIGSTSPSAKLEVLGGSNSTYLKTGGDDSGTNARALTFTSASGTSLAGAVHIINAPSIQGQIAFQTNNGERARITGDGITFNGDTATANALDDYEEGTWTPTFAGVAAAAVYGARYTKIGQLVMVESYIAGDTQNNTNQFQIGGLPYTSQNVTAYGGGSIQYTSSQDYSEFGGPLIPANSTFIYFHRIDGSSSSSVTNNILYNKINGNQLFIFQAFYRTA